MRLKGKSVEMRITEPLFIGFLFAVDNAYQEVGGELIITSGSEMSAVHSRTSLHYAGRAVDSRSWAFDSLGKGLLNAEDQHAMMCICRDDYLDSINLARDTIDIVLESDHIHTEWQPKRQK